jgi:hypothetical protein
VAASQQQGHITRARADTAPLRGLAPRALAAGLPTAAGGGGATDERAAPAPPTVAVGPSLGGFGGGGCGLAGGIPRTASAQWGLSGLGELSAAIEADDGGGGGAYF